MPVKAARKRNRKRKRRVASSSESSSSSSEDSSSSSGDANPTTVKLKTQTPNKPVLVENSASSSESESDSDSSEVESDRQRDDVEMLDPSVLADKSGKKERVVYSRSPSPSPPPAPSFLPTEPDGSVDTESEKQLKDRFRKFWMQSIADAFQDDLAQIHKVRMLEVSETRTYSSLYPGARHEQISAGNACRLFGFRRGRFYFKLFPRDLRRKRDGRCYEQSVALGLPDVISWYSSLPYPARQRKHLASNTTIVWGVLTSYSTYRLARLPVACRHATYEDIAIEN